MLSQEEFRAVFDASPDGVAVVDDDGRIRAVNPKVEQIFGWSASELVGAPVERLIPERLHPVHQGHRTRFVRDPHDRPMGVGVDLRARRKDGTEFPVEVSLSPWRMDDGGLRVICSIRDVTGARRLRNFSEGALRATEDERTRIARELHDDTAQRLATLILRVGQLTRERDHDARSRLFEAVRAEIIEAADGVKRISRGLRPPEIEELGIELALRAHLRALADAGFRVRADLRPVGETLDPAAKLALYRIVQEALSNARRHSGHEEASVRLFQSDGVVVAEIVDEGQGFAPHGVADGDVGLGLIGMQERAAMIGGRIEIDSEQGRGTRIRVEVPLNADKDRG